MAVAVGVTATPIKLPSSRALLNVSVETLICGRMRAPPEMPTAPLAWGSWETADSILAVVSGAMPPRLRELAALVGDDGSWVMLVSKGWLGDGVSVVAGSSLRDGSVAVVPSAADVAVAVRSSTEDVSVVETLSIEDVVSIAVGSEMTSVAEAGSEATLDKLEVTALDSVTNVVSSTSSDVADEIKVGDESATDEAPVLPASPSVVVAESPALGVSPTGEGAVRFVAVVEVVSPTTSELTTDGLAVTDDKDSVVGEATIEDQCLFIFHLVEYLLWLLGANGSRSNVVVGKALSGMGTVETPTPLPLGSPRGAVAEDTASGAS